MIIQCPQCQSRYDTEQNGDAQFIPCRCGVTFFIPQLAHTARAWNCPNCGAGVNPDHSQCEYCKAYLAFSRCPACFSIAPYESAKFCTECGESLTIPIRPIRSKEKSLACPRCNSVLHAKLVKKHLVDVCRDCGGVWISHKLFDKLLQNEPLDSTSALGKPINQYAKLKQHPIRYLPCPECNTTMNRYHFMERSNIILDECSQHGLWFDRHELAAALKFKRAYQKPALHKQRMEEFQDKRKKQTPTELNTDIDASTETIVVEEEDLATLIQQFPHLFSHKD